MGAYQTKCVLKAFAGLLLRDRHCAKIVESQTEQRMDHELETRFIRGLYIWGSRD